jgi:hypothetical protein
MSLNCGHNSPQIIYEHGQPRWNDIDRENRSTRRKPCTRSTLSTTNLTWTAPSANPRLWGEKPATNRLRFCAAKMSANRFVCHGCGTFIETEKESKERNTVVYKIRWSKNGYVLF